MIVQQRQFPKAVLSMTNTPERFLIECSCNCRVFHIFRAPIEYIGSIDFLMPEKTHTESCRAAASFFCASNSVGGTLRSRGPGPVPCSGR